MDIEKTLYESAVALAEKRYPSGLGGAAALYTEDGRIFNKCRTRVIECKPLNYAW